MRKNLIFILSWSGLLAYMVLTMGYISTEMNHRNCEGYKIEIKNADEGSFIEASDIQKILSKIQGNVDGLNVDDIKTDFIENELKINPWLYNAECYKTVDNHIKVNVWQRTPVVRFMNSRENYYMDSEGFKMPPAIFNVAYVPVVSGISPDSLLCIQILELIEYISDDRFLSAQIQQLYINADREFLLIPRAGNQEILFGNVASIEGKFNKLIKLYQEEFAENGWNRYRSIDLRFDNQVICTKK